MKTAAGIRAYIRRSRVPIADWARALGVHYTSCYRMVCGVSGMQEGPLMQRAMRMVQSLEDGQAKWERSTLPDGHGAWKITGLAFTPATMVTYRVNFLGGTLNRIEGVG